MKCLLNIVAITLFLAVRVHGEDAGSLAIFNTAKETYDRGDFAGALEHYRELAKREPGSSVAWYNAANAAFRSGEPGEAVLYYRRAWYLNPRDPDVRANMLLAQQRTGALSPNEKLTNRAAQEFSHREWTVLFKSAYWIAIISCAALIFLPVARRAVRPVLYIAVAVGLLSFGGWAYWNAWIKNPEVVITTTGQTALYEPREGSTQFFAAPEGSILTREEIFDHWIKVSFGDKAGWIRNDAAELVLAW
jgi:tetratricopeptide (TPR) repeat protein